MIYNYRIDILRKGIKIGELISNSCNIKFKKDAEITKSMQISMLRDFTKMSKKQKIIGDYIYFDGTRFFDGTWCFISSNSINESLTFNMFTDRLKPYLIIDTKEYPLGVYMVIAAPENLSKTENIVNIEAYDETMILKQSKLTDRVIYTSGTKYLTIVENLLTLCGFANIYKENDDSTIQTDREFEPGTSYIEIINTLLSEINYNNIYADFNGDIYLTKIKQNMFADFIYKDKNNLKIIGSISKNTDIYDLPNVFVGIVSNPELSSVMRYETINEDVNSQISVVNRGYKVMQIYELDNISSENALREYIDRKRLEASQVTETVKVSTIPEGGHYFNANVQIETDLLSGLFEEIAWQIDLGASGKMTHELERKVFV